MKKIGIITIVDQDNYGNRLQNYATVNVYNKMGYEADTLVLNQRKDSSKYIPRAMRMLKKQMIDESFCYRRDSLANRRRELFLNFSKEYTPIRYAYIWGKKLVEEYDFFSVGSDQIWNCNLDYGYGTEFLEFAPKEKRLCFSPSFGVDSICDEKVNNYINGIQGFLNVSVREHASVELVKNIAGVDATVLIDPTLMLSVDEWSAIEKKPKNLDTDTPYILEYFLSEKMEETENSIKDISDQYQLRRINLLKDVTSEEYCTGPSEFIYLIHHAEMIMTDSFHACVFSILFEKEFYVFERCGHKSMGSRIDSLFSTLGIDKGFGLDSSFKRFEIDYDLCKDRLKLERERVYTFLEYSMKGKKYADE